MAQTVTEKIRAGLVALGYTKEESRSSKYEKWVKEGRTNLWLGKSAGLRVGNTVSDSFGATEAYKATVILAGEQLAK